MERHRIRAIKDLDANFVFLSSTNPIHAKKLGIDQWHDTPVFLSYPHHCAGVECYQKIIAQLSLNSHKTTLVSRVDNLNAGSISERNQHVADTVGTWAESQGIKICKCDKEMEVIFAIQACIAEQQTKENASGNGLRKC